MARSVILDRAVMSKVERPRSLTAIVIDQIRDLIRQDRIGRRDPHLMLAVRVRFSGLRTQSRPIVDIGRAGQGFSPNGISWRRYD
jgi:hypothetical protein